MRGWQSAHNAFVGLDPALARRDAALFGPDAKRALVGPEDIRAIARRVPVDRLLVETDAPYLAPPPHRGKRNEPAFVRETAKCLAETLGRSIEDIETITTRNFFRLFSKVPRQLHPDGLDA